MQPEIDPIGQARMQLCEQRPRLDPAACETLAFPDLVQPAWVAAVAIEEVLAPNAQPARNPNVDRICFG